MPGATPFADLADFVALPRLTGLALSPDGRRLVTAVATLSPERTEHRSALWEVDPTGASPSRRLTRSAPGEAAPAFLPDGSLLFTSKRPDPEVASPDEEVPALWLLPAGGGEARQVAARPGGVTGVAAARDAGTVVVVSPTLPGTSTAEEDADRRTARKDAGVTAILHETSPVRYWDHDLGPAEPRLLVADAAPSAEERLGELRDLTPEPGRALDQATVRVTPDGTTVVTSWTVPTGGGDRRTDVVAVDVATGQRRTLATSAEPAAWFDAPAVSPDGRWVALVRTLAPTWEQAPRVTLWLVDIATGEGRDLTPDLDLWPGSPVFTADAAAVLFPADELGRTPVFRVELAGGEVTRLTRTGAHSDLCPSPDGRHVYALRSSPAQPPQPVRLDADVADQDGVVLPSPGGLDEVPGRLEEVTARAEDGTPLRAWLVLPRDASAAGPAPVAVAIHGGPLGSWSAWSWRWCPHLLAARGYAVLLPDPAFSTGYGQRMVDRGWGQWGGNPYTDVMALTDAALAREDLDAERTAAVGGSYGGYLANWVAGHTDRFRAIVTHASLWALDQFQGTTDHPAYWAREWGWYDVTRERYDRWSPHLHADAIRTPMLVAHGDKDYRVPIGEGLRLWTDLVRRGVPAKFLHLPDENHWVLSPGGATVWWDTVLAFLDHHVLGKEWQRPGLL